MPDVGDQIYGKVLMDEGIGSFEVTDQEYPFNEFEEPEEFLNYDGILNDQFYKSYTNNETEDQRNSKKGSVNEVADNKVPLLMQL